MDFNRETIFSALYVLSVRQHHRQYNEPLISILQITHKYYITLTCISQNIYIKLLFKLSLFCYIYSMDVCVYTCYACMYSGLTVDDNIIILNIYVFYIIMQWSAKYKGEKSVLFFVCYFTRHFVGVYISII